MKNTKTKSKVYSLEINLKYTFDILFINRVKCKKMFIYGKVLMMIKKQ